VPGNLQTIRFSFFALEIKSVSLLHIISLCFYLLERMRWVEHVAYTLRMRNACILIGKPYGKMKE
jgi:hypothetical protein